MESTNSNSNRVIWIVVGAVAFLFALAALAIILILGTTQEDLSSTQTETSGKAVATKEDIERSLDDLNAGIKNSLVDQKAVEEALNDDSKQVKLGN